MVDDARCCRAGTRGRGQSGRDRAGSSRTKLRYISPPSAGHIKWLGHGDDKSGSPSCQPSVNRGSAGVCEASPSIAALFVPALDERDLLRVKPALADKVAIAFDRQATVA